MKSCCSTLQSKFDRRAAARDLRRYRRRGPLIGTRRLVDSLVEAGAAGRLLDIGGGVGAIQLALLRQGVDEAVGIDASRAYTEAARTLAREHGVDGRIRYEVGDFVELAADVEPAEVVTLDRVLCCYPDWPRLVALSAGRARRLYGIVLPRDRLSVRLVFRIANAVQAILRDPFRVFVHPPDQVAGAIRGHGFRPIASARTFVWQVLVFERDEPRSTGAGTLRRDASADRPDSSNPGPRSE